MAEEKKYISFAGNRELMPQEEKLETAFRKNSLTIGIPAEVSADESRIALIPDAVKLLVSHGHRIIVERGAGGRAHFSDHAFAEAGAELSDSREMVFGADIVLKVAPPEIQELELLPKGKTMMSILQLQTRDKAYFNQIIQRKTTAIAFEHIQDKTGALPLVRSMSEIIGNAVMMIAAEYLSHPKYGKGVMLGGFPGVAPTEVVVIGAGNVAEYACRVAIGMGCLVKVFDNSMYKLRSLQNNVGSRVFTSILQPNLIDQALQTADVVIAAKHASTGISPCLISDEMVQRMKAGSVIIDVSIDQGGCFESSRPTTHHEPVFQKYGVTHYAVPNIASRVPRTASLSFSNFFTPLLLSIGEAGGMENMLKEDRGLSKGVYVFNGKLTNQRIAELHGIPFHHLELLMAAFY